MIPFTQSAVGVPHVIDDGHADRVIYHNLNNFWIRFQMKLNYRRRVNFFFELYAFIILTSTLVCIYEENIEHVGLGRIMMSGGLHYSRMKNQNLQYVTVAVACSQRSDPIYIRHGTLSYWRRMRNEFLFRCDTLRLFVDCSVIFSPGPFYQWNLIDILFLQHYVIPWKVNLGLAYFCVYFRGK